MIDHFLKEGISAEDLMTCSYEECADFFSKPFAATTRKNTAKYELDMSASGSVEGLKMDLIKKIGGFDNGLTVLYELNNFEKDKEINSVLGIEFNFSVFDYALSKFGKKEKQKKLIISDAWNSFVIRFDLEKEANIVHYPVETVSDSETGVERTYQELCCVLMWPVSIKPGKMWSTSFKITV